MGNQTAGGIHKLFSGDEAALDTGSGLKRTLLAASTLSIYLFAPLIVPLAVLLCLIALAHGQLLLGLLGILCAGIWFRYFTDPF